MKYSYPNSENSFDLVRRMPDFLIVKNNFKPELLEVKDRRMGVFVDSMVGHTYIKRKMREINAVFAGEVSGHYYFSEFYYSECPLLILVMILNLIENKSFSNIIKPFKKYFRTEEINFKISNYLWKTKKLIKGCRFG